MPHSCSEGTEVGFNGRIYLSESPFLELEKGHLDREIINGDCPPKFDVLSILRNGEDLYSIIMASEWKSSKRTYGLEE